jgi:hypothetical protein
LRRISSRGKAEQSWFETAQKRLLTMRPCNDTKPSSPGDAKHRPETGAKKRLLIMGAPAYGFAG